MKEVIILNLKMDMMLLVSILNTKLRNDYNSLEDLSEDEDIDLSELLDRLETNRYYYDQTQNQVKKK
ncbi:MAG: DUF4250 domain-containing protein [Acholeplasma sp.]|nr:DUF4250 domain-containing protein [Acholeplasma sp.]